MPHYEWNASILLATVCQQDAGVPREDKKMANKMVDKFFNKILGSNTDRYLKKVAPVVQEINAIEPKLKSLSDDELRARTDGFKERIQNALGGIDDKTERRKREQEVLHEILPEAFATVREASVRVTEMRHFDVQLLSLIHISEPTRPY